MTRTEKEKLAVFGAMAALICLLAALLYGCAGKRRPHPVQPTPPGYKPPAQFWDCAALEQITFPGEAPVVRLRCPFGYVLVDRKTGKERERVTWAELAK